ncbi:hypothetical protein BJX64DRAFT_294363 [Aspergillus heterothallicus]
MASISTSPLWDAQGNPILLQEPPKISADDGMYHPYTGVAPAVVEPTAAGQGLYAAPLGTVNAENTAPLATVHAANAVHVEPPAPALNPYASLGLDELGRPLQVEPSVAAPTVTISVATSVVTSTVTWSTFSSFTTLPHTSDPATASSNVDTISPSTSQPSATNTVAATPLSSATDKTKDLTDAAKAGIALSVMSMAMILVGLIFWRVERKRKALNRNVVLGDDGGNDDSGSPQGKASNPVYSLASSLYTRTRSTLTLASIAEKRFKSPHNCTLPSICDIHSNADIDDGAETSTVRRYPREKKQVMKGRAYDLIQRWLSASCSFAQRNVAKIKSLRAPQPSAAQRRSRQPYEYGFCEKFLHIPPPEPTRPEKILARVYTGATSVMTAATKKLNLVQQRQNENHPQQSVQPEPQLQLSHNTTTASTLCEEDRCQSTPQNAYDGICDRHSRMYAKQLGLADESSSTKDSAPTIQSVLSGVATVQASPNSKGDAVIGRILEEDGTELAIQAALPPSPPMSPSPLSRSSTSSATSSPSPPPHPPQAQAQAQAQPIPLPVVPKPAHSGSLRHLEVPSVITRTFQVYRVEFSFASGNTGHLEVTEGQTVQLEQSFEDGWALCKLTETGRQGLIPRAYLSTWPIRSNNQRLEYTTGTTNSSTVNVASLDRSQSNSSNNTRRSPSVMSSASPVDIAQPSRFYRRTDTATSGQELKGAAGGRGQTPSPTGSVSSRS